MTDTSAVQSPTARAGSHPWTRYVAMGDSFTEGIGDPEPSRPGGYRGWADRVAEELGRTQPDFAYANLAVRGRLLQQIVDSSLPRAWRSSPTSSPSRPAAMTCCARAATQMPWLKGSTPWCRSWP